ncbi:loganic acid O-methyltransferase-like isoform X2 [Macadamia integrifolia]|uniref:loganic acid O-methyltransferase-like isoform X2 n=1 Tax=Macadamia integrifolia TaxID=60698 RepID=UPI001C52C5C0|nr:loganic acid O-methyltransferase-like isoform X2 [Macadamia integrifolia]
MLLSLERERERDMEDERNKPMPEEFPMNGGDGPYSYAKNSTYQRRITNISKARIDDAIAKKLDIKSPSFTKSTALCIADLGCSVGPNTFIAMQNIVEAIKLKYGSEGLSSQIPDFQVFFQDHVSNDFNTLFASLPPDRPYFATGVPGSFHGRLFPKASLHLVHSSIALHWLSMVPKEVLDKDSPAWNKGKIHYGSPKKEVVQAYSVQFAKDIDSFLLARAEEIVPGGLMVLKIQGLPNGIPYSQTGSVVLMDLLGSSLMDMAKMGLVSEAKVDSFNIPLYNPHFLEMEGLLTRNDYFSLEGMELVTLDLLTEDVEPSAEMTAMHVRAGAEGMIKEHFGIDIIDELFDRLTKKIAEDILFMNEGYKNLLTQFFVILKRKE